MFGFIPKLNGFFLAKLKFAPALNWLPGVGPKMGLVFLGVLLSAGLFQLSSPVLAAEGAQPWGVLMQDPASPVQGQINNLHHILLWIIVAISVFVLALLVYVMVRYNHKTNPVPSTTTHHTKLEIIWTVVPCLILLGVAFPSFKLLYYSDRVPPKTDLTLKVTGHQWYWSYEYDQQNVSFDSHALWDQPTTSDQDAQELAKESAANWLIQTPPRRMLEVDNRLVLPLNASVRVQINSGDVEHSWFLPSMGINRMAVPGRTNEVWLRAEREGVFYGQCSMICGTGHGFMPIVVEVVPLDQFQAWLKGKKSAVGMRDLEDGIHLTARAESL